MPSNNVPVNGWPQLKLLDKVQPILNKLDKIERWQKSVKLVTRSGNVVTVPNALALDAQSLKVTFAPIQSGSGDPSPSNVRPISGHTGVSVVVSGKNLTTIELGSYNSSNGAKVEQNNRVRTPITPIKAGTYNISYSTAASGKTPNIVYQLWANDTYGSNTKVYDSGWTSDNPKSITISSDTYISVLLKYTDDSAITLSDVTLSLTETQTHTTPFGSTYYSGYVDIVTGELVVDSVYQEFDGSIDEEWSHSTSFDNTNVIAYPTGIDIRTTKPSWSNMYVRVASVESSGNGYVFGSKLNIRDDVSGVTLEGWKTWLSTHPLQMLYTLTTPIRIELTPEQVTMFARYNTIYADIGPIEIVLYTGDSWS